MIATDLTSISTHGWFFEPSLSDRLTPVSTFGWYYIEDSLVVDLLYKMPLEILAGQNFDKKIPVSFLGTLSTDTNLDRIPIEIIGAEQFWTLDGRGILWTMNERDTIWVRDNCGFLWTYDIQNNIWTLKERS